MKGAHNHENKTSTDVIIWRYFTNCLSTFD